MVPEALSQADIDRVLADPAVVFAEARFYELVFRLWLEGQRDEHLLAIGWAEEGGAADE